MIRRLKSIYHYCQLWNRYIHNLRLHRRFIKKADLELRNKTVTFDVPDNRFTRHLYNFILFFIKSGYSVYIKKYVSFIGNLQDYSEFLLETKNLFIVAELPQETHLKFSTLRKEGDIELDDNYFSLKKSKKESLSYPFSMHPEIYRNDYLDQISQLRKSKKRVRIFFAGAIHSGYKHKNFLTLFNVLDRYSLFQNICHHYSHQELLAIETKQDFELFEQSGYLNKIVIIKSGQKHFIPRENWLPLLARADFFLAFPGVKIMSCHNLIEAMSLGVIPIIQNSDYLPFQLENNMNCIKYESCDELFEKIDEIIEMDNSRVKKLGEGVIDYYETYLKPGKIIGTIEQKTQNGSLKKFYMYSELNSVDRLRRELRLQVAN